MRKLAAVLLFGFALGVQAQTITSISPSLVKVNSGEHFITVYGTGLGTRLVFDGPAGHYERNVSVSYTDSVVGWVPEQVVQRSGTYTLYVSGANGNSNSVSFTVQGFKVFPLVIIMPEILIVQPASRDGAYVKYEVFPAGGDDPSPTVRCFPESGSFFRMGQTTVDCTATNIYGEKASGSMQINVADRVAPILEVPRDPIVVKATSREGAIVEYKAWATDEIWGDSRVDCSPASGSIFPIGITDVQCTATDLDLNISHASFPVEVLGEGRPYSLGLITPGDFQVPARSAQGTIVDYSVKVTNTNDPNPDLTCLPKSGTTFPVGPTVVNCSAIDYLGARGSASFLVDVIDQNAPTIRALATDPSILSPADGTLRPVYVKADAYDDIDLAPVCQVQGITSNERIDLGDGDSEKNYQWKIVTPLQLELRATVTGKVDRYYNITVSCTDFFGNARSSVVRVVVPVGTAGDQQEEAAPSPRRRSVRR